MYNESWCISKANNCRSWLTNHRRFNFTTRNVQAIMHASLRAFRMVTPNFHAPPKVFIILLNRPSQLIRQYFTRQLVQVSLFAKILPLQNFPTYGSTISLIMLTCNFCVIFIIMTTFTYFAHYNTWYYHR